MRSHKKSEFGNALFLILIAVALFAALSYAITQSSRNGGNITRETNMITAARLSEIGAATAARVQRMVILGTPADDIVMHTTGMFGFLGTCSSGTDCLYAPEGGGLTQPDVSVEQGIAAFSFGNDGDGTESISGVGTAAPDIYLMAVLTNEALCQEMNRGLGIDTTIYKETTNDTVRADGLPIAGQPYFCFDGSTTVGSPSYVYIHVLHER